MHDLARAKPPRRSAVPSLGTARRSPLTCEDLPTFTNKTVGALTELHGDALGGTLERERRPTGERLSATSVSDTGAVGVRRREHNMPTTGCGGGGVRLGPEPRLGCEQLGRSGGHISR